MQSAPEASYFQNLVNDLAQTATGSANRIARLHVMHVMHEPPSIDKGEVTDKGSINQRAVLAQRSVLVSAPHADAVELIFKPVSS